MVEEIKTESQRDRLRHFLLTKGLELFRQRYFLEQPGSQCWVWTKHDQILATLIILDETCFVSGNKACAVGLVRQVQLQKGQIITESLETIETVEKLYPHATHRADYLMTVNEQDFRHIPCPDAAELTEDDMNDFKPLAMIELKDKWRSSFLCTGLRFEEKAAAMAIAGHFLPGVGAFVRSNLTLPEYRGRGFSKQVMSLLVELCLRRFPVALLYGPLEGHPAYSVYKKLGFKVLAKHYFLNITKKSEA